MGRSIDAEPSKGRFGPGRPEGGGIVLWGFLFGGGGEVGCLAQLDAAGGNGPYGVYFLVTGGVDFGCRLGGNFVDVHATSVTGQRQRLLEVKAVSVRKRGKP